MLHIKVKPLRISAEGEVRKASMRGSDRWWAGSNFAQTSTNTNMEERPSSLKRKTLKLSLYSKKGGLYNHDFMNASVR